MTNRRDAAGAPNREITITRVFEAPRELVWKAWTDPQHVARWWGPRGFETRVETLDLRPGGKTRYVMVGPDGTQYPVGGVFLEVIPLERFVSTDEFGDDFPHPIPDDLKNNVVITCTFEALGDRTKVTIHIVHPTEEARRLHEEMGVVAGWNSSFDCLDDYLAELSPARLGERDIVLSRVLGAPRELVWKAWTDADHLARWWGPVGFTTTTRRMDVKPGGEWRFIMHGPDGRDYENLITYLEVVEPERLTYKHGGDVETEPVNFAVTVTFEPIGDAGDRTRVFMRMEFPSKNARDFVIRNYNAAEGGRQTMSRLGEYVRELKSAEAQPTAFEFNLTRVLNAPRDVVWRAWTQKDQLARWFGPKDVKIAKCSLDLRPGGRFHYLMQGPDGTGHWGMWTFREIVPNERIVSIVSFADEHGNVIRAPFDDKWPLEILSTITFVDHAGIGGGTVVSVKWTPQQANEVEQAAFKNGYTSMEQGWRGTIDALVEFLANAKFDR